MLLQISDLLHGTDQHSVESGFTKSLLTAFEIPFRLGPEDMGHRQHTLFSRVVTGRDRRFPKLRPELSRIHIDSLHMRIIENCTETVRALEGNENTRQTIFSAVGSLHRTAILFVRRFHRLRHCFHHLRHCFHRLRRLAAVLLKHCVFQCFQPSSSQIIQRLHRKKDFPGKLYGKRFKIKWSIPALFQLLSDSGLVHGLF